MAAILQRVQLARQANDGMPPTGEYNGGGDIVTPQPPMQMQPNGGQNIDAAAQRMQEIEAAKARMQEQQMRANPLQQRSSPMGQPVPQPMGRMMPPR
jgi:hypothetical protein